MAPPKKSSLFSKMGVEVKFHYRTFGLLKNDDFFCYFLLGPKKRSFRNALSCQTQENELYFDQKPLFTIHVVRPLQLIHEHGSACRREISLGLVVTPNQVWLVVIND